MAKEINRERQQEIKMFDCTLRGLDEVIARMGARGVTAAKFAVSLLSDAQEELALGHTEMARKTINRAKYVLTK